MEKYGEIWRNMEKYGEIWRNMEKYEELPLLKKSVHGGTYMNEDMTKKIKDALENVKPWQRVPTSIGGVFLVKTPAKGNNEMIMVEINPLDELGTPMKRRGLFLKTTLELESFVRLMQNKRLQEVMGTLDVISGVNSGKEVETLEI